MAMTTIPNEDLRKALTEIRECEGECTQLLHLERVLDAATNYGGEVYLSHDDLDFIQIYI